ncbi:unnamed protein product [Cyclocybe aegerita]|uniref:DUF6535 domain-containing protein n=1 Tax=Cyclocybe aegerita TaxID=1973307 RepID=A0A8S0VQN7_CYCAE|nr:unnamed protein product [Cyclocybe aegerita]
MDPSIAADSSSSSISPPTQSLNLPLPVPRRSRGGSNATLVGSPSTPRSISQLLKEEPSAGPPAKVQDCWDELGSEADEYANIWQIYNEEAGKKDATTTEGSNRGIDGLLVFTGLFSAVLTTFIIQSYQQMIPNPSDATNALLIELIALQRDAANLTALPNPNTTVSKAMDPSPSETQIHGVNGLWFAALACSLSAALISMLAKQWIQYTPHISGSPRYRARQRQRRYMQLKKWHVFAVINALPLLLHAALLLFFAGLLVLLWSGDIAITAATFVIVAVAYIFYVGSMWMSFVDPDCPYQHPITEHLRSWVARHTRCGAPSSEIELESNIGDKLIPLHRIPMHTSQPNQEDYLDAYALVWLLQECNHEDIVTSTLQAIGGLPINFTAFHVLRDAGVIPLVLQQFNSCFHRDSSSFDHRWHITKAGDAEKYCRAWVRLTHNTVERWPRKLLAPLNALKDMPGNLHVSSVAACASALDSLDLRGPQLALVTQLRQTAECESNATELTQLWLLETFLEASMSWELEAVIVDDITRRAIPVLLRLLQQAADMQRAEVQSTIALVMYSLTGGSVDYMRLVLSEPDTRRETFHKSIIWGLGIIVKNPHRYGVVDDDLFRFAAMEFATIAAPAVNQINGLPAAFKNIARQGLSKLYLEGNIGAGLISDSVLADILQILHPILNIPPIQYPSFVKTLLRTLAGSSDVNVALYAIRLLESLLGDCHPTVVLAFIEENGVAALLRVACTGDTDNRRLQIDCIRMLCIFVQSSNDCSLQIEFPSFSEALKKQFDDLFQSNFFPTIISVISARRWWLPEIAEIWVPSILYLCEARPHESVWPGVEAVLRKFAELNVGEDGSHRLVDNLDRMAAILRPGV